jgi:hypothetical protein
MQADYVVFGWDASWAVLVAATLAALLALLVIAFSLGKGRRRGD